MTYTLKQILNSLHAGKLDLISIENCIYINNRTIVMLKKESLDKADLAEMKAIIIISNTLYNNTDKSILPLEDGVYDLLVARYNKETNGQAPIGAIPIKFEQNGKEDILEIKDEHIKVVSRVEKKDDMIFFEALTKNSLPIPSDFVYSEDNTLISKRVANTAHTYPELVGTLDKCKFVMNSQAAERGLLNSDNVQIFERDFLEYHSRMGINANELLLEIKYDGISVEAEVDGDTIISARSRGDTQFDEATDLTPIFGGYVFDRATNYVPKGTVFGIKFEAIITYKDLQLIKERYGKSYVNARNAIIGLTSGLDARKYRDYITLVPLACSGLNIPNRIVEIEFLNKYYSSGIDLRYDVARGDYVTLLFQVKRFVEEAEYMRAFLPFMYDGIVVSYTDPSIINYLGRVNSVNKYSIAIKFNSLKKQTIFTGYTYSIGQNGLVTPMANFNPVEFLGGIHTKTTAHSLKRFYNLGFKVGDIADLEFVDDVILYITRPDNTHNRNNPNPIIEFPSNCPSCGSELVSNTGNSAYCLNPICPERNIARMANMLKKLNIKDFSTQTIRALGIFSLSKLLEFKPTELETKILGEVNTAKLMERIKQIKNLDYPDYRIVGSIGFSSIAVEKWRLILKSISLESLINKDINEIASMLTTIKGIGDKAAEVIKNERDIFLDDLIAISKMPNVVSTHGDLIDNRTVVRFSGVRDEELENILNKIGYDADGNKSVTKKTQILIVPHKGYQSDKTKKVGPQCQIITLQDAWLYVRTSNQ